MKGLQTVIFALSYGLVICLMFERSLWLEEWSLFHMYLFVVVHTFHRYSYWVAYNKRR